MTNQDSFNPYLRDAATLLRAATALKSHDFGSKSLLPSVGLLYAVGLERVLKALLFSINPLYVYKDPDFKNSVSALYGSRITNPKSEALAKKPNHDVITFREALLRATVLSPITHQNAAKLHAIGAVRDLVAHCDLSLVDERNAYEVVYVYAPNIIAEYEKELQLETGALDGRNEESPREKADRASAEDSLRELLATHAARWQRFECEPSSQEHSATKRDLLLNESEPGFYMSEMPCPACNNLALLKNEIDYDWSDGESIPQGAYPIALDCPFCDLRLSNPYQLDAVGAAAFV